MVAIIAFVTNWSLWYSGEARNKLLNFKSLRMKSSISSLIVVKGAYGFKKSVWTDGKSRKSMV